MKSDFINRQIPPMTASSEVARGDSGAEKHGASGAGLKIPDEDGFKLMMDHKRSVAKVSLFVGIPLVYVMAIKNFIKGDNIMAFLNCMMLLILVLLGFVIMRRIEEKSEYKIYSILFRLFFAAMGVSLFYDIGFQSNFSRIEWCYIYPVLVFLAVGVREGAIWVSIFYGILAFFILDFDLQGITLFQIQELRTRFLFSFFAVCTLSFLLEHGFRRIQQRLLHHQSILKESENRYRQAYEQLNIEMQERRQAEEASRVNEARFHQLFDDAPVGYHEFNTEGRITRVNRTELEMLGYTTEEMLGRHVWDFVVEKASPEIVKAKLDGRLPAGQAFERTYRRKDGTIFPALIQDRLLSDEEGRMIGIRSTIQDITELKRAEEALSAEKQRFQTLSENAPFGIALIDKAGTYKYINPKFRELFGYDLNDIPDGKTWFRKACPDPTYRHQVISTWMNDNVLGSPKPGEKISRTFTVTCKDGTEKIINFFPVKLETGEHLTSFVDFTLYKKAEEALRSSEERYRNIVENIEEAYYEDDLAGNFTFVNSVVSKHLGYSAEELVGMNYRQYTDEKTARELYQSYNTVYNTGKPSKRLDVQFIRKDGTKRFFEVLASPIKDSEGKPIGFRGVSWDVTERKEAEEEVLRNKEKLQAIMDASPIGISWADMKGNIEYTNRKFRELFGYTVEDIPTIAEWRRLAYPDPAYRETIPSLVAMLTEAQKQGREAAATEATITCKDGSTRCAEQTGAFASNRILAMYNDLTGRKLAEEALRQSEERYRSILENMQEVYYEIDLDGNWIFLNDAFHEHLGYTKEEMIGKKSRQYQDEATTKKLYQAYTRLYRTGEPIRAIEGEWISKDGAKRTYEMSASLIRDSEGKPIGFRGVSRDVTERKRAEEERLALQQQLRQSQKMEAIGHLAGGVAHDFNNLLTVIHGYSELLLNSLDQNSRLRQDVLEIKSASERASSLTNQLLAFSRKQLLQPKVLDLNVHVSSMDKMFRRTIGENIELVSLLAKDLRRIKVDPGQIEQVILNLAINARDAMPNGGKLMIETANVILDESYARSRVGVTPGRYVMLSVSDTGSGMTPEIKERIFEPFFTTKEKGKGTGLGLSTVYGIIQQSCGDVWVYSEPGVGTTFKIYLPAIEEGTESLRPASIPTESTQGFETILLVEDEEMVRKLACTLLRKNGYTVLEASNGEEALLIVKGQNGNPIHLMVTDVVMPGMSGRQLADRLLSLRPEMKVLYMSGYTDDAIVHHGVLDPGIAYIQKPFASDAFASKVRQTLDGRSPST